MRGPWDGQQIGPSVAADGTQLQTVGTLDLSVDPCTDILSSVKLTLYLSQKGPDGSATFTPFHTETSLIPDSDPFVRLITDPTCPRCNFVSEIPAFKTFPTAVAFRDIPDGQGGALVPWWKVLGNLTLEAHLTHISGGSVVNQVTLPLTYQNVALQTGFPCHLTSGQYPCLSDFRLVLGENGVAFATDLKSVVAFDIASLSPLWTYSTAAGMDLVASTADGGVTINDFQQGLVPLTAQGTVLQNLGGQVTPLASYSWSGQWFASLPSNSALYAVALPLAVDTADAWATPEGNPSQGHSGDAICDCLVESTDPAPPPPPATCPICNLAATTIPSSQPPSCTSTAGTLSTYLILIGDSATDPQGGHNVGNLFNLAAQTQANTLQAQGHSVVACRVSTIQQLDQALTTNGLINGGVIFFGHAGVLPANDSNGVTQMYSLVSIGASSSQDANIAFYNVADLSGSKLGSSATITFNACHAGATTPTGQPAIAQLVATALKRTVFAFPVGMYFNQNPNDTHFSGAGQPKPPNSLPMYMLPEGASPKRPPAAFRP